MQLMVFCFNEKINIAESKAAAQAITKDSEIYEGPSVKDQTKYYVFSDSVKVDVDVICKIFGRQLQHQSDRNLPRTYFPKGITPSNDKKGLMTKKKISAHEEPGVIVLLLLMLCSSWGDKTLNDLMGGSRLASFIHLFELLLMYEEILKVHEISRRKAKQLAIYTPLFLDHFKRTVNRYAGMGCNFIKFHLPLHISDDILRNGVCQNSSSGPGESRHKSSCKQPAKLTQRVYDKFEMQSATMCTDHIVIDRAHNEIISRSVSNPSSREGGCVINTVASNIIYQGRSYVCDRNGIYHYSRDQCHTKEATWNDESLQNSIYELLRDQVFPHVNGNCIHLLTECKREGVLFRAHPAYKDKEAWQDWAYINWEGTGDVPGQLMVYIDLKNMREPFVVENNTIDTPGIYAIIHSVQEGLEYRPHKAVCSDDEKYKAHTSSRLVFYAMKIINEGKSVASMQPKKKAKNTSSYTQIQDNIPFPRLYIVSCDSIASECVAIPDYGSSRKHGYLFLRSRKQWSDQFFKLMEENS